MLTWTGDTHMQSILRGIQMKQISFMILPKKQVVQMFFLFPSFTEYKIQNLCAPDHTWSSLYNKTPFSPSNWKFCSFWNVILSVVLHLYLCIYYFSFSFSHFQSNPILFICYLFICWTKQINNIVSRVTSDIN